MAQGLEAETIYSYDCSSLNEYCNEAAGDIEWLAELFG